MTLEAVEFPEEVAADFVEFLFKDQFISRADIWRFKSDVIGEVSYLGKTFDIGGTPTSQQTVRDLRFSLVFESGRDECRTLDDRKCCGKPQDTCFIF